MRVVVNSIAFDQNRWTKDKVPANDFATTILPRIIDSPFDKVEMWQYHCSGYSQPETEKLKATSDDAGISYPVFGVYPKFHLEGEEAEIERELIFGALDRASILGASWIKFFFGGVKGSKITEEQLELTTKSATNWIQYGREKGLQFCAELHGGTLFDPFEFGFDYINKNADLDVKVCFQPYDFENTEPSFPLIETLGNRIVHAHFQGRKGKKFSLLQDADLDYTKLISALSKANPDFIPSVEFVTRGFPPKGEPLDFDGAFEDAITDARFIESQLGK